MDDDIVDFMILTFARSRTLINAVMRPEIITQEKQMSILNEMSRELDLDAFVMKTVFKMMTKNKQYDDEYLNEAKDCCYSILKNIKDVEP